MLCTGLWLPRGLQSGVLHHWQQLWESYAQQQGRMRCTPNNKAFTMVPSALSKFHVHTRREERMYENDGHSV